MWEGWEVAQIFGHAFCMTVIAGAGESDFCYTGSAYVRQKGARCWGIFFRSQGICQHMCVLVEVGRRHSRMRVGLDYLCVQALQAVEHEFFGDREMKTGE